MAAAGSFDDTTTLGSSERPGEDHVCSPLLPEDTNSCRATYKLTMPWQICFYREVHVMHLLCPVTLSTRPSKSKRHLKLSSV